MKLLAKLVAALLLGIGIWGALSYGLIVADSLAGGDMPPVPMIFALVISLAMLVGAYLISNVFQQPKQADDKPNHG